MLSRSNSVVRDAVESLLSIGSMGLVKNTTSDVDMEDDRTSIFSGPPSPPRSVTSSPPHFHSDDSNSNPSPCGGFRRDSKLAKVKSFLSFVL